MTRTLPRWRPEMSDGCSVPTLLLNFAAFIVISEVHAACVAHDEAYYYGGSARDRMVADVTLLARWLQARDEHGALAIPPDTALMMFTAVRLGGGPQVRDPRYSWAFGGDRFLYDSEPAVPKAV